MSEPAEISVLLPVHNAEATLDTCLTSLLRQRETRWECVLVDDGSSDRSGKIAATYAAADPRIRISTQPRGGLVRALQQGLEACHAPYVARMDADDWMHRERLSLQRAMLEERPELSAIGSAVRLFPRTPAGEGTARRIRDDGSLIRSGRRAYETWLNRIVSPSDVAREAFVECPIAHPTLFARREVLLDYGYRDRGWAEDYDLILRMLAGGQLLAAHPRRLLGWRDSPGRLSRQSDRYATAQFTACKAAFLATGFLARDPHYILWGYGDTGRALRKALLAYDRTPSHIVDLHPRRIGQQIHGAPVIEPEALRGLNERHPLLASVAGEGPRNEIRSALDKMGFDEGRDYICAA